MKTFSCIASIDQYLQECAGHKSGDCIGLLGDKPIYIIGLFTGKGNSYFGSSKAIRWNTKADDSERGFWNRGLSCYMSKLPDWALSLPKAK